MSHTCHWPGCRKAVPPKMWGCSTHWFKLPAGLRARIWATYRPGQEITKTPSDDYVRAAQDVQRWIAERNKPLDSSAATVPSSDHEHGISGRAISLRRPQSGSVGS